MRRTADNSRLPSGILDTVCRLRCHLPSGILDTVCRLRCHSLPLQVAQNFVACGSHVMQSIQCQTGEGKMAISIFGDCFVLKCPEVTRAIYYTYFTGANNHGRIVELAGGGFRKLAEV